MLAIINKLKNIKQLKYLLLQMILIFLYQLIYHPDLLMIQQFYINN